MKKTIISVIMLISLMFSATMSQSADTSWNSAKACFDGAVRTVEFIDTLLAYFQNTQLNIGQTLTTTRNGVLRKIKLSEQKEHQYKYLLEVWAMHDSNDGQGLRYQKGIEFRFNNSLKGEVILRGAVFNETNIAGDPSFTPYEEGHWCKAIYNHSNDIDKNLDIYYIRVDKYKASRGKYHIFSNSKTVNLYMTAIMPQEIFSSCVYTLGAVINQSSPYNTTAKYGVNLSTEAISFLWPNGAQNTNNAGIFNQTGFISDGYTGTDNAYPDPSIISESQLPTKSEVESFNISFSGSLTPDF